MRRDTFNRANTASAIGTPSDGGLPWSVLQGTWGVDTNMAYESALSGQASMTLLADSANVEVRVIVGAVPTAGKGVGITVRESDLNNFVLLYTSHVSPDELIVFTRIAGSFSAASDTIVLAADIQVGDEVMVRVDRNNTITGFVNGVLLVSCVNGLNATTKTHGLYANDTSGAVRYDSISITEILDKPAEILMPSAML